ncbi:hypothetical protein I7I53_01915 [Histoplasma capsulatum var. duboisii H88]|uniref:Uncharacterized protein n=1 Tax=Ajellomyces capsulatus (strain H88) TaxID=544711 RepID=A0A8A1LJ51_AJEC8|nr:hypothetical protein I7I53_01915 [Histoplasma capsulatum var. duboisii H88]
MHHPGHSGFWHYINCHCYLGRYSMLLAPNILLVPTQILQCFNIHISIANFYDKICTQENKLESSAKCIYFRIFIFRKLLETTIVRLQLTTLSEKQYDSFFLLRYGTSHAGVTHR